MTISLPFGPNELSLSLPDSTDVLRMGHAARIPDPEQAIQAALAEPIGCAALERVIAACVRGRCGGDASTATACIVIADNTRPVPYRGPEGILVPIVDALVAAGIAQERIVVLVGTGTHHPLTREIEAMLDPQILASRVRIVSHDCRDADSLRYVGTTPRGTRAELNTTYLDADIRISTGLVESHFFAGASGGRKAICPGIVGEQTTYSFHSAAAIASPDSTHLKLDGNPHHEESLAVASMVPPDFTVNVTLDGEYHLTGVFAGELDAAHRAAVELIRNYVRIPVTEPYDVVLTHGGFVAINHYQAVKAALVALPAVASGGFLYLAASHTDTDPVGWSRYRTLLHLLRMIGPEAFIRLLFSDEWTFLPDQWEVQSWAKVCAALPRDRFWYYAPQLTPEDYEILPGSDANLLLPEAERHIRPGDDEPGAVARTVQATVDRFLEHALGELVGAGSQRSRIAFLADGPYGIVD